MTWGDCIISARTETQPGAQFARREKQLTSFEIHLEMKSVLDCQRSRRPTGLGYGLVDAFIECQVPDDADDVPLDLQGIPAQLINPLEELQATVGNYMVAVALDLRMTYCLSQSTTFTPFTHPLATLIQGFKSFIYLPHLLNIT